MTTTPTVKLPLRAFIAGFRRFSVAEYEELTRLGFLTPDDKVELLDGYLVKKMARNPPHDGTLDMVVDALRTAVPAGWLVRDQRTLVLATSVPEPDFAIVRGAKQTYLTRHPTAADTGIVVEVSDSTLDTDRRDKCPLYAAANIPVYWIVNILARTVEVYTDPDPAAAEPLYRARRDYAPGETLPVVLDGVEVAGIVVGEIFP